MKRRQFLTTVVAAASMGPLLMRDSSARTNLQFTVREGGQWLRGPIPPGIQPAAIKLPNGMIYDFILVKLGYPPWRYS